MNFYPHHISDFNNATRHLTRVERSVYRDAIERYYDTEHALPSDLESLARRLLCFSVDEIEALKTVLSEFFTLTDDGYINHRCEHEIEKYRANTSAKARAGKASAMARQQKSAKRKHRTTDVEQNSTDVHNHKPITINQEPIEKKAASANDFVKPSFDQVQDYCLTRRSSVNPGNFINYYDSVGWMIGKKKMKDWQAAVRTWEKNDAQKPVNSIIEHATDRSWSL
jgi:uncharacterized protein YdaU (DUF1376 family)